MVMSVPMKKRSYTLKSGGPVGQGSMETTTHSLPVAGDLPFSSIDLAFSPGWSEPRFESTSFFTGPGFEGNTEFIESVLRKTLESVHEVQRSVPTERDPAQIIRLVAGRLADKADTDLEDVSIEQGWQQLLEQGLRSKLALLSSKDFKSTTEAAPLLGIKEPAVRKRIAERKLLALRMPGGGDYRIPFWAVDPKIAGSTTATLLGQAVGDVDPWELYHFMSTPDGGFNGLRPFECLMSRESLPSRTAADRDELSAHLKLPARDSLLETVEQAWRVELAEHRGA